MNVIEKRARQSERLEAIKLGKTWCKNAPYLAPIYGYSPNPKDGLTQHNGPCKAFSQAAFRVFIDFLDIETQIGLTKQLEGTEEAKR